MFRPLTLNNDLTMPGTQTTNLVAFDDALTALAAVDSRKVRVVDLCSLQVDSEETAEMLKVSPGTLVRDLRLAKVWLRRELKKSGSA